MIKVFKFGGASIKDAAAMQNVGRILQRYQEEKPLVVISALGKTTNALETVVQAYFQQQNELALERLQTIRTQHEAIIQELFPSGNEALYNEINDLFVDVEWILEEPVQQTYDYIYDQIVSVGELLSTKIMAFYLQSLSMPTTWLDVRDCIATDNTYRDANVDWTLTEKRIQQLVPALLSRGMVVTQGFLGVTSENFTTTLGREGSDYTAAIFSYCLHAGSMTIWKDVAGVLTGDPRLFADVVKMDSLSYEEAIEMTYYGAQVIHPKTLRPLQNRNIPLFVKCFLAPDAEGTRICAQPDDKPYPPIVVVKANQTLLHLTAKDFHFVDEARFARLFDAFARHRIKVNMTQNTALAFAVCVNNDVDKIQQLVQEIEAEYALTLTNQLKLITLRHADEVTISRFANGRTIYLEERIHSAVQLVMHESEHF